MTILPWISFDRILEEHHNEKFNMLSASEADKDVSGIRPLSSEVPRD